MGMNIDAREPMNSDVSAPRVALLCASGREVGVGHVMRCLALGQQLQSQGVEVLLWGPVRDTEWLSAVVDECGIGSLPAPPNDPATLAATALEVGLAGVVVDGYDFDPAIGHALRARGIRVLAMHDGVFGAAQEADVYVDQNLDATPRADLPSRSQAVAGLDYVLFRNDVLAARDTRSPDAESASSAPSVVCVFGGTDPLGAAPLVVPALLATGLPMNVTAIAGSPAIADRLNDLTPRDGQQLTVLAPQPQLTALTATADLVVTAAGSSVWELLCMGTPAAVVAVNDNQLIGYSATTARGVATGIGELPHWDPVFSTAALRSILSNPRLRDQQACAGQELIDGRGRQRVAELFLPELS